MTVLTAAKRATKPASYFALPDERFPVGDPEHARLAIGGATRAEHAGNITPGQEAMVKRKARARLGADDPNDYVPMGRLDA